VTGPIELAVPPPHPKRVVFFGTPDAAVPCLEALVDGGFEVPLVVSTPDRRRGRRSAPSPSPVKSAALDLGLVVTDDVERSLQAQADVGVVVAYGHLIRRPMLERLPMLNVHFSLLPRWRGAAPVERAILAGDDLTGVCLMGLEVGLDTGPVYGRIETPIEPGDTAADLRARLASMGAELLIDSLRDGLYDPKPQVGEPTHAAKIVGSDRLIDWSASAQQINRQVRVGGAFTSFRHGRFKIHEVRTIEANSVERRGSTPGTLHGLSVQTGTSTLELVVVQPEGKPRQDADAWARGAKLSSSDRFEFETKS